MQSVASSNITTDWVHSNDMYNIRLLIDILWCVCHLFCITKQINIMPVYLSGASCAQVSNQSFLNNLAKESHMIIQYDELNHIFVNANNRFQLTLDIQESWLEPQ